MAWVSCDRHSGGVLLKAVSGFCQWFLLRTLAGSSLTRNRISDLSLARLRRGATEGQARLPLRGPAQLIEPGSPERQSRTRELTLAVVQDVMRTDRPLDS